MTVMWYGVVMGEGGGHCHGGGGRHCRGGGVVTHGGGMVTVMEEGRGHCHRGGRWSLSWGRDMVTVMGEGGGHCGGRAVTVVAGTDQFDTLVPQVPASCCGAHYSRLWVWGRPQASKGRSLSVGAGTNQRLPVGGGQEARAVEGSAEGLPEEGTPWKRQCSDQGRVLRGTWKPAGVLRVGFGGPDRLPRMGQDTLTQNPMAPGLGGPQCQGHCPELRLAHSPLSPAQSLPGLSSQPHGTLQVL